MKRTLSIFALFVAAALVFAACEKMQTTGPATADDAKSADAAAETGDEETVDVGEPTTPGTVGTVTVAGVPFSVEYAVTDAERATGLMDRESLPDNAGMWFVFPHPVDDNFWMKDTLIPLDLIFVGENMEIVHIHENATPKSLKLIGSPVDYMYVLEINGGKSAENGFKVGDKIEARIGQ